MRLSMSRQSALLMLVALIAPAPAHATDGVQLWDIERGLLSRYDGTQTSAASIARSGQKTAYEFLLRVSLVREPDPAPKSP